jgi:uncharacterized protein HemX
MANNVVAVGKKKSDILTRAILLQHSVDRIALDMGLPEESVQAVIQQELRKRIDSQLTPEEQAAAQAIRIGFVTEQAIRMLGNAGTDERTKAVLLEIVSRQNSQLAQLHGLEGRQKLQNTQHWSRAEIDQILSCASEDEQRLLAAGDVVTLTAVARRAGLRV